MHLGGVVGAGPAGIGGAVVDGLAGDVETEAALLCISFNVLGVE